jgi:hypothetical protein
MSRYQGRGRARGTSDVAAPNNEAYEAVLALCMAPWAMLQYICSSIFSYTWACATSFLSLPTAVLVGGLSLLDACCDAAHAVAGVPSTREQASPSLYFITSCTVCSLHQYLPGEEGESRGTVPDSAQDLAEPPPLGHSFLNFAGTMRPVPAASSTSLSGVVPLLCLHTGCEASLCHCEPSPARC